MYRYWIHTGIEQIYIGTDHIPVDVVCTGTEHIRTGIEYIDTGMQHIITVHEINSTLVQLFRFTYITWYNCSVLLML